MLRLLLPMPMPMNVLSVSNVLKLVSASALLTAVVGCAWFRSDQPNARDVLHPDADVRREAVQRIGETKVADAVPVLVDRLLKDPDPLVRSQAARALGSVKSREAVPYLIEALKDTHAVVRWDACEALAALHDPAAVDPLMGVLKADDSTDVRRAAARTLGTFAEPRVLAPLAAATGDLDRGVAKSAANSLLLITGLSFGADREAWERWLAQGGPNSKLPLTADPGRAVAPDGAGQ